MQRKFSIPTLFILLVCVPAFLFLTGCGGGGGGSSSGSSGGIGTVAVLLTDGPADDYDNIWIWITEISLLPEDYRADPVVVFESDDPDGWKVDLLDLRDQDAIVTVRDDIPAGQYRKIRLRIADIQPEGGVGPCDPDKMEIKLPSGKIDLKPKGGFEVVPGETISIRLDIDCDKSIGLHKLGHWGKCIFRPVVFVEIDKIEAPRECPRILKGIIGDVFDDYAGFTLLLGDGREPFAIDDGREPLTVFLADGVIIFGENGVEVSADKLESGQLVHVRGRLDQEGNLQASVIVIGGVVLVKGTVDSGFDGDIFSLELMPPHIFTQNIVDVAVSPDTFVMTGCDQRVEPDVILAGMLARVVGKISLVNQSIQAIAVMLKDQRIPGTLTAMSGPDGEGGYTLTVQVSETDSVEIYMPADVEPYMENIGSVPIEVVDEMLNCGKTLEVNIAVVSKDAAVLEATAVRVYPAQVESNVLFRFDADIEGTVQVLLEGNKIAYIPQTAIVEDQRESASDNPTNEDVATGDTLLIFGLETCQPSQTYTFYEAYMVIILAPEQP